MSIASFFYSVNNHSFLQCLPLNPELFVRLTVRTYCVVLLEVTIAVAMVRREDVGGVSDVVMDGDEVAAGVILEMDDSVYLILSPLLFSTRCHQEPSQSGHQLIQVA